MPSSAYQHALAKHSTHFHTCVQHIPGQSCGALGWIADQPLTPGYPDC